MGAGRGEEAPSREVDARRPSSAHRQSMTLAEREPRCPSLRAFSSGDKDARASQRDVARLRHRGPFHFSLDQSGGRASGDPAICRRISGSA